MSEEFWKGILALDGGSVTLTGLLLAFIIASIIGLKQGIIVTGGRHTDLRDVCSKCEAALTAANASLEVVRERDVQSRLELERLRTQREYEWRPSSRNRPPENSS